MFFRRIVPSLEEDESPTSKSDASEENEFNDIKSLNVLIQSPKFIQNAVSLKCLQTNAEDDEIGDGLRTTTTVDNSMADNIDISQLNLSERIHQQQLLTTVKVDRRRRKLPEIPKNKKCELISFSLSLSLPPLLL